MNNKMIFPSLDAYHRSMKAEEKRRKLQQRKEKLRALLDEENRQYEVFRLQ